MMSEDLKACPFCGEQPELRNDDDDVMREIVCSNCDFAITESANPNGAVAHWNTRPQSDRIERLVEALRWALSLAERALEEHRSERLRCGHNDIRGRDCKGATVIGLWQSEIDQRDLARTALNEDASHGK